VYALILDVWEECRGGEWVAGFPAEVAENSILWGWVSGRPAPLFPVLEVAIAGPACGRHGCFPGETLVSLRVEIECELDDARPRRIFGPARWFRVGRGE